MKEDFKMTKQQLELDIMNMYNILKEKGLNEDTIMAELIIDFEGTVAEKIIHKIFRKGKKI